MSVFFDPHCAQLDTASWQCMRQICGARALSTPSVRPSVGPGHLGCECTEGFHATIRYSDHIYLLRICLQKTCVGFLELDCYLRRGLSQPSGLNRLFGSSHAEAGFRVTLFSTTTTTTFIFLIANSSRAILSLNSCKVK